MADGFAHAEKRLQPALYHELAISCILQKGSYFKVNVSSRCLPLPVLLWTLLFSRDQ